MFTQVRRFIKTAIAFLFIGLTIGAVMLVQRELYGVYAGQYLQSAHLHAIGIGFMMFLILGVALWLFPRAPKGDTRYSPKLVGVSYWILTVSTGARVTAEIIRATTPAPWLAWLIVAAGVGQVAGIAIYFWTMWSRIRPVGSHLREQAGEIF